MQFAVFFYNIHNNALKAKYFTSMLSLNAVINCRGIKTRGSGNYFIPSVRTDYRRFSIKFRGPTMWNSIPQHIKGAESLSIFKSNYHSYLITLDS